MCFLFLSCLDDPDDDDQDDDPDDEELDELELEDSDTMDASDADSASSSDGAQFPPVRKCSACPVICFHIHTHDPGASVRYDP